MSAYGDSPRGLYVMFACIQALTDSDDEPARASKQVPDNDRAHLRCQQGEGHRRDNRPLSGESSLRSPDAVIYRAMYITPAIQTAIARRHPHSASLAAGFRRRQCTALVGDAFFSTMFKDSISSGAATKGLQRDQIRY